MPRKLPYSKDKKISKRKRERQLNGPWRRPVENNEKSTSSSNNPEKSTPKTTNSTTTTGLSVFEQSQILEFKEAFSIIDANRDGIIDVDDLSKTFNTLGISKEQQDLQDMIDEAMGPMNFSIFLNMLAERIGGVDPEDTL